MANKKNPDGVQATIERLTGQVPCPQYLRDMLNKYLYEPTLFPGAKKGRGKAKVLGKLKFPETDVLVHNLLLLDPVFLGDTPKVVALVCNGNDANTVDAELARSASTMQQRRDIYTYWSEHLPSLKDVLKEETIDLRTVRLDSKISATKTKNTTSNHPAFFLRAVQQLEQSEQRGRLSLPSVGELIERADAYLALGDYSNADANACKAIEQDEKNSRAWFVRVMATLRQGNFFSRETRRHAIEAVEIAEPMSAHERQARELADEAANNVHTHLTNLRLILPEALLHWPKTQFGQYDHLEQYVFVRNLFISQLFAYVFNGLSSLSFVQTHRGFSNTYISRKVENILNENEAKTLKALFSERDKAGEFYFTFGDPKSIQLDLQLLHLRSFLDSAGYAKHWENFCRLSIQVPPTWFEKAIVQNENLGIVWQEHYANNEGEEQVNTFLYNLESRLNDDRKQKTLNFCLKQNGMQFDRLFRTGDYQGCLRLSRQTQGLFDQTDGKRVDVGVQLHYPSSDPVSIPVGCFLYWKYLEVLSLIKLSESAFQFAYCDLIILANAETLSLEFTCNSECFWTESEEYEDGGGEEWLTEPFDIDLRDSIPWIHAIELILKLNPKSDTHELLEIALGKLMGAQRPFAKRDFDTSSVVFVDLKKSDIKNTESE